MKIRNIVFSGFMGAILATASNAAPTIASKAYVDGLVDNNVSTLNQTMQANYDQLSEDIALNADAIADNATAIQNMDAAYKTADEATLSSAKGYTDQEITKLNDSLANTGTNVGALSGKLDSLTERVSTNETGIATNKTNISTNATNILSNAGAIETLTQTVADNKTAAENAVKALADNAVATNTAAIEKLNGSGEGSVAKKIADAIATYATIEYVDTQDSALDTRVKANEDYIAQHKTDYSTLTQTVADNKTAAEKAVKDLTDGQVTTNKNDIATLMANAETTGSVDNKVATSAAQTKTAYETYAIPKPSDSDCDASSGLCVLSVSSDGTTLQWVDVTDAVVSEPEGGEEA